MRRPSELPGRRWSWDLVLFAWYVVLVQISHAYPAVELTKVIINGGMAHFPFQFDNYILELITFWLFYLAPVLFAVIYWKYIRR